MKNTILLISILGLGIFAQAQKTEKSKLPKFVPHMVETGEDGMYVGMYEVSVYDWFNFLLNDCSEEDILEMSPILMPEHHFVVDLFVAGFLPNTEGYVEREVRDILMFSKDWDAVDIEKMNRSLVTPVTGVKHEWIARFLEFESDRFDNDKRMSKSDYGINLRLPSEKEWEDIAKRNLFLTKAHKESGQRYTDTINEKGCPLVDVITVVTCESSKGKNEEYGYVDGVVKVNSYNPTTEGVFCLFGNAAEMVAEKGVAKGGSSFHYAIETQWDRSLKYEEQQSWVGFRYVGVLVKK